jgi:hypothetical protein
MPTINTATSQGGYLILNASVSFNLWEDLILNTTNAGTNVTSPSTIFSLTGYVASRGGAWNCRRGYLTFDTSAIPGALTALSLNIYVEAVSNFPDAIIQSTPSPNTSTALNISDWQYVDEQVFSDPFSPSVGWMNIELNAAAVTTAQDENYINFVVRDNYYDYDYLTNLTDPTVVVSTEYRYNYASFIPYLDYTSYEYGQTVNGIIAPNMANVDGVPKLYITRVLGVSN